MHIVGSAQGGPRRATAVEVADLELRGAWVVDVRRHPRAGDRSGWLLDWEDDIVFLADSPAAGADEVSERVWPLDAA